MKHGAKNVLAAGFIIVFSLSMQFLLAQGPIPSYYYAQSTELSFAECYIYQDGGSMQKLRFLPVVNRYHYRAPIGTNGYKKDIDLDADLVFIGNGIYKQGKINSYYGIKSDHSIGEIDVKGKVVIFCYDPPEIKSSDLKEYITLEARISEAYKRGAVGVITFPWDNIFPFHFVSYKNRIEIPDIPVISITKDSLMKIIESSGLSAEKMFQKWKHESSINSGELITSIRLKIKGKFSSFEGEKFIIKYLEEKIPKEDAEKLFRFNEKSVTFLLNLLKEDKDITWHKLPVTYFRGFDSKVFYTHHWGSGLACDEGIFNYYDGKGTNYGLIVHENAHHLVDNNWTTPSSSGHNSFVSEGIAMYAQAAATDKDMNNNDVIKYLKNDQLFPLSEMIKFTIGLPGLKTDVGYPASGSFIEFLIDEYGLLEFKKLYKSISIKPLEKLEDINWEWRKVYSKPLQTLEKEWLNWLADRYNIESELIDEHLKKGKSK